VGLGCGFVLPTHDASARHEWCTLILRSYQDCESAGQCGELRGWLVESGQSL